MDKLDKKDVFAVVVATLIGLTLVAILVYTARSYGADNSFSITEGYLNAGKTRCGQNETFSIARDLSPNWQIGADVGRSKSADQYLYPLDASIKHSNLFGERFSLYESVGAGLILGGKDIGFYKAGAGVDYKLTPELSVGLEYQYLGVQKNDWGLTDTHTIKVKASYDITKNIFIGAEIGNTCAAGDRYRLKEDNLSSAAMIGFRF
jgi:opacity protein-like surface antigen